MIKITDENGMTIYTGPDQIPMEYVVYVHGKLSQLHNGNASAQHALDDFYDFLTRRGWVIPTMAD
jgi:hypothetical protein